MDAVAAKPAMEADPAKKFRLLEFKVIFDLLIFSPLFLNQQEFNK
jgi:hypothetical protein